MKMTKEIWLNRIYLSLALAKADGKHGLEIHVTSRTRDEMEELGVLDALPSSVIVTVLGELRGDKAAQIIVDELARQAKAAAAWPFPAALPGYNWNRKYPGEAKNPLDEGTRTVDPLPGPEAIKKAWEDHAAKVDKIAIDKALKMTPKFDEEDFAKAVKEIREEANAQSEPDDFSTVSLYRDTFNAVHNVLLAMCHKYTDEDPATLKRITIEVIE